MPRYGFNFQWMFSRGRPESVPKEPDLKALDFMARHGFEFARIPTDYRFWTKDFDYLHPDETVFEVLDRYLNACTERGIHMSLNLHRAPGYCINRPEIEKHDLWADPEAQDGFVFLWETFAKRYRGRPSTELSFDLLNEPPAPGGRHSKVFSRDVHEAVMRRTVAAIRAVDPDRAIALDGISGGGIAIPELADLGVVHSGRGYVPFQLSHFKAGWTRQRDATREPGWPLVLKDKTWDKDALREYYAPWREVQAQGVTVHIGEFGCFNKTSNEVALAWFRDLLALYREYGWGYALWNFKGSFGIVEHGRPGTSYEACDGYQVDRELFDLLCEHRSERPAR